MAKYWGDSRFPLGQEYDQIHAIQLSDKLFYRRAHYGFGYDANTGRLQPLQTDLNKAIDSLIKHLEKERSSKFDRQERRNTREYWKERVKTNIDEKLENFYFDLDGFAAIVKKITQPNAVKDKFYLFEPEGIALKEVAAYFSSQTNETLFGQIKRLFSRSIKRLLDYRGDEQPHPALNSYQIFALRSAELYLHHLDVGIKLARKI